MSLNFLILSAVKTLPSSSITFCVSHQLNEHLQYQFDCLPARIRFSHHHCTHLWGRMRPRWTPCSWATTRFGRLLPRNSWSFRLQRPNWRSKAAKWTTKGDERQTGHKTKKPEIKCSIRSSKYVYLFQVSNDHLLELGRCSSATIVVPTTFLVHHFVISFRSRSVPFGVWGHAERKEEGFAGCRWKRNKIENR